MHLDAENGLVPAARIVASPNFEDRPPGAVVDTLIIHCISLPPGQYGGPGIEQLFLNRLDAAEHPYYAAICHLKVSSHFLIRRDGGLLQFVPVNKRAWHAGVSWCEGRGRVNDFSIGIELEGIEDQGYEPSQYATLTTLTRALMQHFPELDASRIYGHQDIAPGRKTDPGSSFDWDRYLRALDT